MRYAEFITLMALTISVVALSTDAILPALAMIGDDLGTADQNHRQLVIGVFFLGLAASQLLFGPLSDSIGRKPVMYLGFALFTAGCLISIWAQNFETMLAGRFIQGFGVAAPRVVSSAVIRDRYDGRLMAKTTSLVMSIFILVPVVAPMIGQMILLVFHWTGIFWLLLFMALVMSLWIGLRLPESLVPENRTPFKIRAVGRAFLEVISTRVTMGYLLASACLLSMLFGYITSAQQILQELYGLGDLFPIVFGALAGSLGVAYFVNARLVIRLGTNRMIQVGLATMMVMTAGFATTAFAFGGLPPLWLLFTLFGPTFFCFGLLFGNMNALAMQPMGHIAGSAAAVIGTGTMAISAVLGTLIGQMYDGTVLPLAVSFLTLVTLASAFTAFAERRPVSVAS